MDFLGVWGGCTCYLKVSSLRVQGLRSFGDQGSPENPKPNGSGLTSDVAAPPRGFRAGRTCAFFDGPIVVMRFSGLGFGFGFGVQGFGFTPHCMDGDKCDCKCRTLCCK